MSRDQETRPEIRSDETVPEPSAREAGILSRRHLLTSGTAAAAAVVLGETLVSDPAAAQGRRKKKKVSPTPTPVLSAPRANTFPQPPVILPDGSGNTNLLPLNLSMRKFNFCQGNQGEVRSYDGYTPGPTLVVRPGGTLNVELLNNLPKNQGDCANGPDYCGCGQMNKPHCFNTTNMHFHGLHVSPCSIWNDPIPNCAPGHSGQPDCASDDVLFEIPPIVEGGLPQCYNVVLPEFHGPGTHWYHAHKHGSTAIQVANGMAGALIIPEAYPIVAPHKDFIWLLQEVLPNNEDWKIYPGAGAPDSMLLTNGECCPTLVTQTGLTLRLRFINATGSPRGFTRLRLIKCGDDPCYSGDQPCARNEVPRGETKVIYLMAVDGITFYGHTPQPKKWWDLSPGNRSDFLVQFDEKEVGTYMVVKDQVPGVRVPLTQILGYIEVQPGQGNDPDPATIQLPPWSAAPDYIQPIQRREICDTKTITFNVAGAQNFQIGWDAQPPIQYDPDKFIKTFLGCTEAWTLKNTSAAGLGQPHPFHIHVNPFQLAEAPREIKLIDVNGPDTPDNWIWWDVIAIPAPTDNDDGTQTPGQLVMWTRFWDYPGTFVLHCHILVHEDLGMMANMYVQDPKQMGVGPCEPLAKPIPVFCQNPKCLGYPGRS